MTEIEYRLYMADREFSQGQKHFALSWLRDAEHAGATAEQLAPRRARILGAIEGVRALNRERAERRGIRYPVGGEA